MPPKKPDGGDGFTFLVTTNPLTSSEADKKRVRSAAALKSWPERRKRTFEQLESSTKAHGASSSNTAPEGQPIAERARAKAKQPKELRGPQFEEAGDEIEEIPRSMPVPGPLITPVLEASGSVFTAVSEPCIRERSAELPCRCIRCAPLRYQTLQGRPRLIPQTRKRTTEGTFRPPLDILTPPPSPRPLSSVNDMADPFNCYPVPYRKWFDDLLHHMLTVYAPRGWPALKITNEEGLSWEWFMTQHALAEPALFYVRLLFASGDLIRLKVLKPEVAYWLRAQAIQAINEALKDPKRATSDALILAIGRISLNESLYGDRHAADTMHRPAHARMIQMRGGMKALPFPPLVKRLMRWQDTVLSKRGGTSRMLEDDEEQQNFTMSQSVNVLERWAPQEGQELRRKIKISDLVND
jgi:hypothetical protein